MTSRLEGELAAFRAAHPPGEATLAGRPWRWADAGDAARPTVLLLGGALGRAAFGFPLVERLSPEFRVLAPDYPAAVSVAELTTGLVALLDRARVARAHVVGGSFGGFVAQALVRRAPGRVASLVLSHTGAPDGRSRRTGWVRAVPTTLLRAAMRARLGRTLRDADPFWRRQFEATVAGLDRADIVSRVRLQAELAREVHRADDLAGWGGRVLILDAVDDPLFSAAERARLLALYPGAEHHAFEGTGHAAALLRPDEYAARIAAFVRAQAAE